ncbi:WG repeat-containing protein [Mucilaginibacter flavus]|uniref:WG repeat-containing protein n=1 Tax=Mucilaginibacter flavus TaxID=931504 RepID=UPI0025B34A6D|nr:YARHG domain-containing protein [Mucilaginibacter flavus]MDN3582018.1 WG repeat-containing protein [Mucilaginibacter flavus]
MKTKPILIIIAVILLIAGGAFFYLRIKNNKPGKGEVQLFLNAFNKQIKAGNVDSAKAYFEDQQKGKLVKVLLNVLCNKTNTGGKDKPLFKLSMNTEDALITVVNSEFVTARVATKFTYDGLPQELSTILFTIHKIVGGQYKITQVDARGFVKDYVAFQTKVYNKITPVTDIYSAITLAAFKAAEKLQTRYDSVLWFDHVNNKTFYYVIKGKLPDGFNYANKPLENDASDYKMGLVNPDLKEIIPVEYDLIHNVSGAIEGLIEVEKAKKKGFYKIDGKMAVPVEYDEVYPLKAGGNLAVLKNGDDFFYLKADTTVSEKIADFKVADMVPLIKTFGDSYTLSEKSSKNIMEYNSKERNASLVIAPSYLVNLQLLDKFLDFPNPLRKVLGEEEEEGSGYIDVAFDGEKKGDDDNWFQTAFYSIADDYLGGRGGLYKSKSILVVDKKHNQILGFNGDVYIGGEEGYGELSGSCNENSLKAINDSLFEYKTTAQIGYPLFNPEVTIDEGTYYRYLQVKNGKFVLLPSRRVFPTQFIKLDDSYLQGCYVLGIGTYSNRKTKTIDHVTKEILQYMKNEIYASYKYRFKAKEWNDAFAYRFNSVDTTTNVSVDDSLTVIDKYNIAFINSKLNGAPILNVKKVNTLAAR